MTTGRWQSDATLDARRQAVMDDLQNTNQFREVDFIPVDATTIQKYYTQANGAISKDFDFQKKVAIPDVPGVKQAFIGVLPAKTLLDIITEDGELIESLFYDNVRDWLGDNPVNGEMKRTLESSNRARFVLMNNGITIIARDLILTGDKIHIEGYQVVNGCQTSHAIFEQIGHIDSTVMVPVRIIVTQDEEIVNSIITATNRQTEVTDEQFYAIQEFPKALERLFSVQPKPHRLYCLAPVGNGGAGV